MKREGLFIVRPSTVDQVNAIKAFLKALHIQFEVAEESPYAPEFVEKLHRSKKEFEQGKFTRVDKKELENFLGL
ncbi:MAG: DUF2683 family protein [Flavobacteriales bacterium]|jgi:hypothetical protein